MAKYLVSVNCRYKEYYLVDADSSEEAKLRVGDAPYLVDLFEYVEEMPRDGWDDPVELSDEEAEELLKESQ